MPSRTGLMSAGASRVMNVSSDRSGFPRVSYQVLEGGLLASEEADAGSEGAAVEGAEG